MRVICIDDTDQFIEQIPHIKKGNIYTVIDVTYSLEGVVNGIKVVEGIYYVLAECGDDAAYHKSMFIEINEDQIDETELINQREQVTT